MNIDAVENGIWPFYTETAILMLFDSYELIWWFICLVSFGKGKMAGCIVPRLKACFFRIHFSTELGV